MQENNDLISVFMQHIMLCAPADRPPAIAVDKGWQLRLNSCLCDKLQEHRVKAQSKMSSIAHNCTDLALAQLKIQGLHHTRLEIPPTWDGRRL